MVRASSHFATVVSRPRDSVISKQTMQSPQFPRPAVIRATRGNSGRPKCWSAEVTQRSNALDLERGVFTWDDRQRIAESLKRSAEASTRRKGSPLQSAMAMLNFYINRAGRNRAESRRRMLERAKAELRVSFAAEAEHPARMRVLHGRCAPSAPEDAMTRDPLVLNQHQSVASAIGSLQARHVRRAPVTDASGMLSGMVSSDDLLAQVSGELANLAKLLSCQVR